MKKEKYAFLYLMLLLLYTTSCRKLVNVGEPDFSVTTTIAFSNDESATASVLGIYSRMLSDGELLNFCNSSVTILSGLSADELTKFISSPTEDQFKKNDILPDNSVVLSSVWRQAYQYLYHINACIEGLSGSDAVTTAVRNQLLGEVKFLRAFIHFYLVNYFGDVPLITTTDWRVTSVLHRTSASEVYQQIIEDLEDAEALLSVNYPTNDRVRPNKYTATALLARVYLYSKNWVKAEASATLLINTGLYTPLPQLNEAFLLTSQEAIWQLLPVNEYPGYNGTYEALKIIPNSSSSSPIYIVTDELMNAFEVGDKRKEYWLDSQKYQNHLYLYPYKYKVRGTYNNTSITEAYTILRCAEQYLIRAEARANMDNIGGAVMDLNVIRTRAGLSNLSTSLTKNQCFEAVEQERRIELFAEWGHRWFDLKRTNRCDVVLGPIKNGSWQTTDQLYPIPIIEIQKNPNINQNSGY